MALYINVGPWVWTDLGMGYGWAPPESTIGSLDLRSLPDQAIETYGDHPYSLFVTTEQLGGDYYSLGADRVDKIKPNQAARNAWASFFGQAPIGDTVLDWLWNLLTIQADPQGFEGPKPIVPGIGGASKLLLGGHSCVKAEKIDLRNTGRYESVLKDLLRHDFEQLRQEVPEIVARRALGHLVRDFKIHPSDIARDGLPPATPGSRVYESFNGSDSATLGIDQTWVEQTGAWDNSSNTGRCQTFTTQCSAYCTTGVSSTNHICIVREKYNNATSCAAPTARHSTSAMTFYTHFRYSGISYLRKFVGGTLTNIGSTYAWTPTDNHEMIIEVDGSSQRGYIGCIGPSALNATDTAISSGTTGGLYGYSGGAYGQAYDWELLDDAVIKIWTFPSDVEGWTDQGGSGNCTVGWDTTNTGLKQTATGQNATGTEQARSAGSETWEDWGVPSGALVQYVRALDGWWNLLASNTVDSSGPATFNVVENSGYTHVTSSTLLTVSSYGTTTSTQYYTASAGRQAVNPSYQPSDQGVQGEWEFTFDLGDSPSATTEPMHYDIAFLMEYTNEHNLTHTTDARIASDVAGKVVVKTVQLPTGTNTVDATDTGSGTPSAAIVIVSQANTTNNPQSSVAISFGVYDGTNQYAMAIAARSGVTYTDTKQEAVSGSVGIRLSASSSNHNYWSASTITDGIRLARNGGTDPSVNFYATVVLFYGIAAKVGTLSLPSTGNTTSSGSLGFTPGALFLGTIGEAISGGEAGGATFSIGVTDGTNQRCHAFGYGDQQTTSICNAYIGTTSIAAITYLDSLNNVWDLDSWGSDSFAIGHVSGTASSDDAIWLALDNSFNFLAHTLTTPASTGTDNVTTTGINPGSVFISFTNTDALNTLDTSGCDGNSLGFYDGTSHGTAAVTDEDGATTSASESRYSTDKVIDIINVSSGSFSDQWIASVSSFGTGQYTLNWTTTAASGRYGIGLAISNAEFSRTHTTDAALGPTEVQKTHTTDAALEGATEYNRTHTTDAKLLAEDTPRTHTTDAHLYAEDTPRTHTTDALLLAEDTPRTHTTDALLYSESSWAHTTDALLQSVDIPLTHTTDALLYLESSWAHTTDALLQSVDIPLTHTTDALLQSVDIPLTHTTDALLHSENTLTHTTDALLHSENTRAHTTDALLQGTGSLSHLTDALLQSVDILLTHTTDALLHSDNTRAHTTDALLLAEDTPRTHTTDALLYSESTRTHTTDALLLAEDTPRTHTTDALLYLESTRTHTTDALLLAEDTPRTHTTDSLLYLESSWAHTTDALLYSESTRTHTTDSLLYLESTRVHTTDALLQDVDVTHLHTTDALLQKTDISLTHTTDALLFAESTRIHTTDALLQKEESLTHTTDALLSFASIVHHTTNALLLAENSLTHTTNALLLSEESQYHTTDALISLEGTKDHTTNALLLAESALTHTTNTLLLSEETISHTTDALIILEGTNDHTTDALLLQQIEKQHTTDALLKFVDNLLDHTTDARLVFRRDLNHTTDARLINFFTGLGTFVFSEFELSGTGAFTPSYKSTSAELEFSNFQLVGVGTFEIVNLFDPDQLEKEIWEINRRRLEKFGWGIDGGLGCSKPQKPYRCIVYSDKLLLGELDPLNEDKPELLSETIGQPQYDAIAADAPDHQARIKAEARQLARIGDPRYFQKPQEVVEEVITLPRFLAPFHISIFSIKSPPQPGNVRELPKPEIKPEPEILPQPPQKVKLTKPTKPTKNIPSEKTAFHRLTRNLRRDKRGGKIRLMPQKQEPETIEMAVSSPCLVKLHHGGDSIDVEPDLREPPRYLNTMPSGLANRRRRR